MRGECERAVAIGAAVIGVNARDLQTMEINTDRQRELIASLPVDDGARGRVGHRQPRGGRGRPRRRRRRGAGRAPR